MQNSYISTDDTGLSVTVMMLEDIPAQYAQLHRQDVESGSSRSLEMTREDQRPAIRETRTFHDFYCYPGLDDSDEEELDSLSQSYEIQMDQKVGFHRQRSNTDQKPIQTQH